MLQDAICFFKTNSVYHFRLASNGKCFENEMCSHDLWQHEILFLFSWDKIYSWYHQQYKYFESTNTDIAHSLWSLNWHCHLSQVSIKFSNHFILKQVIKYRPFKHFPSPVFVLNALKGTGTCNIGLKIQEYYWLEIK